MKFFICIDRKGYVKEDEMGKEILLVLNIIIYLWYDGLEWWMCFYIVISKVWDIKLFIVCGLKVWLGFFFILIWIYNYVLYFFININFWKR